MCCIFKAHAKVKCITIIAQKDKEGLVVDFCEILTLHIKFFSIILMASSFSHSVMSDSLQPHGLQKARLPCPSPSPRACSHSWATLGCHPHKFIFWHPLLLLPSIFASIRVFSNELALRIRWPKFIFNNNTSNKYSGLIAFRFDWFDLLAVQGTLKNLLQHYSWKASILWCSVFFIVQLSLHTWLLEKS